MSHQQAKKTRLYLRRLAAERARWDALWHELVAIATEAECQLAGWEMLRQELFAIGQAAETQLLDTPQGHVAAW